MPNESLRDDLERIVNINYFRRCRAAQYHNVGDVDEVCAFKGNWRNELFFPVAHIVPLACLFIDMLVNKVRMNTNVIL